MKKLESKTNRDLKLAPMDSSESAGDNPDLSLNTTNQLKCQPTPNVIKLKFKQVSEAIKIKLW